MQFQELDLGPGRSLRRASVLACLPSRLQKTDPGYDCVHWCVCLLEPLQSHSFLQHSRCRSRTTTQPGDLERESCCFVWCSVMSGTVRRRGAKTPLRFRTWCSGYLLRQSNSVCVSRESVECPPLALCSRKVEVAVAVALPQ